MFKPAPVGKALSLGGALGTIYGSGTIVFDEDVVDPEGLAGLEFAFSRVSAAILSEEQ